MRVFEISIWNINYLGHREWHSSDIFHWADKSQLPLCTRDIWWVEFVEPSETICFSLKELSKSGQMDNTSKWLFLSTAVKESGITPAESGIYNLKWGASQTKDSLFVFRGSRFALGLQWCSFRSQLGWLINANACPGYEKHHSGWKQSVNLLAFGLWRNQRSLIYSLLGMLQYVDQMKQVPF